MWAKTYVFKGEGKNNPKIIFKYSSYLYKEQLNKMKCTVNFIENNLV